VDGNDPSRRDFLRLAAAVGLLGPVAAARPGDPVPLGEGYLRRGLVALADAHKRGWLQGHNGAAVLSSYYFCRENRLDERATAALGRQIDAFIAKSPEEFPAPDPGRGRADPERIVERLSMQIDGLRAGGHDVIFASIALRALKDLPEFATPQVVDGICRLLELVARRAPEPDTAHNREHPLPPYASSRDIAHATLRATLRPWGDVRRVGASGVIHWITHADAVITLSDLGHDDLARRRHAAQRLHVNQAVTGDDLGEPDRAPIEWRAAEYWESERPRRLFQDSWLAGHAFKLPYSLFRLLRRCDDDALARKSLLRATHLQVPFE